MVGRYDLPPSIAEDMRPYLVCGLMQGDGHFGKSLNGHRVTIRGQGPKACGNVRSRALDASDRRLTPTMDDAAVRRSFLKDEFEKADRFLRVIVTSEELTVDQEQSARRCGNQDDRD